jgi:hypothetical protein
MKNASQYNLQKALSEKDLRRLTLVLGEHRNGARFRTLPSFRQGFTPIYTGLGAVRQLSRILYKSALFMQNKANLPAAQNSGKPSFDKGL